MLIDPSKKFLPGCDIRGDQFVKRSVSNESESADMVHSTYKKVREKSGISDIFLPDPTISECLLNVHRIPLYATHLVHYFGSQKIKTIIG
jgi:hypothetical protein